MGEQLKLIDAIWMATNIEAEMTNCNKRKVGCTIFNLATNQIVAVGHNWHENGICDCIPGPSTAKHSEIVAIDSIDATDVNFNKDECIALVNRKPCDVCNKALNKVVYEVRYRQE